MANDKIYPDLTKVISILNNADNKELKSRKTDELYILLHKIPDVNPRVAGHILTRNTAVSSFGWDIVYNDGSAADNVIIDTKKRLSKAISFFQKRHALTHIFGHQYYKVEWNQIENFFIPKIDIADITQYHCYNSILYKKVESNYIEVQADNLNFIDMSSTSNQNGGIMRTIIIAELLRLDAIKEQANFIKKLKGLLQIINKGGDAGKEAAELTAKTAIQNNFLISDEMIEVKLNELVGHNSSFKEVIENFNNDIAIAFLGQSNTSELPKGGGSRAALQVMKLISADIHYSDIIHFEDFINDQLLLHDYQINYKNEMNPPYTFKIKLDEEVDIESSANAVSSILNTGLPFKKSEVYSKLNMSIPESTDEIVQLGQFAV